MTRADDLFRVVRNEERQYSIWPAEQEIPAGWEPVGEPAERSACLDRVGELWTDMRPASLQARMGQPTAKDAR